MDIVEVVNQAPVGFQDTGGLELIGPEDTLLDWQQKREDIKRAWSDFLGTPPYGKLGLEFVEHPWEERPDYTGRFVYIKTEPDYYEKHYLLVPKKAQKKHPAVLVPYYDIDTMVGEKKGGAHFTDTPARFFALELVRRGYVVLAARWFYQGQTEGETLSHYYEGVKRMEQVYPGFKGLSKIVSDLGYALDYLESLDFVDSERIGVVGHSLGGKMGLYIAAFDGRIAASVLSELGIGMSFSNWDAPWYLGPEVRSEDFSLDHHQLLGLIAPRPVLLIAGDDADTDKSWYYVNCAKSVYDLWGCRERIGLYNHRSGHSPTKEAMEIAYTWLDRYLKPEQGSGRAEK